MLDQLIQRVFVTRNMAHLAHWKTKSYSQHMALGDFYDGIVDGIDKIVEAHQGVFGLVEVDSIPAAKGGDIIKHLQSECVWIAQNREKIAQNVAAIENLIDGLSETYMTTIYKLKNLS